MDLLVALMTDYAGGAGMAVGVILLDDGTLTAT